jgi:hypothetical protein
MYIDLRTHIPLLSILGAMKQPTYACVCCCSNNEWTWLCCYPTQKFSASSEPEAFLRKAYHVHPCPALRMDPWNPAIVDILTQRGDPLEDARGKRKFSHLGFITRMNTVYLQTHTHATRLHCVRVQPKPVFTIHTISNFFDHNAGLEAALCLPPNNIAQQRPSQCKIYRYLLLAAHGMPTVPTHT